MIVKFVHQELNEDVHAFAGYYTLLKEVRLKYKDREVLYITGLVNVESSCCGSAKWPYVLVPGFINRWHCEKNANGYPVTEVELISDDNIRKNIIKTIQAKENINSVELW